MNYLRYIAMACMLSALVTAVTACGGGNARGVATTGTVASQAPASAAAKRPVQYTYTVKRIFPHDTSSYTQGLFWHEGYLWESTGQYGESALKKVDLTTGKAVEQTPLERQYFGEGSVILDGKIYVLTWTDGVGFIYDAKTLSRTGQFRYSGEGWGLTTDGKMIYMSDGSHQIRVIDPEGFKTVSTMDVRMGRRGVFEINELEWIDGRIWANIYMSDSIVIIDPATGQVEGIVDLQGILPAADRTPATDVLNGIAYDPEQKRIFVTGKNWNKLFEIEINTK